GEIVGEDFERDRAVAHDLEHLQRKGAVIADIRLAHQRGVRREAFDVRLGRQLRNHVQIDAVREQLHFQVHDYFPSMGLESFPRYAAFPYVAAATMTSLASSNEPTMTSGF